MTHLSDYDISQAREAVVRDNHRITPPDAAEVRSLHLEIPHPDFDYREGQNIGVIVPGEPEFGHDRHFRLYTIASAPHEADTGGLEIELCVRRCFYIDEVSGEAYPGIASNYLCDRQSGDSLTITGPYGDAFTIPEDPRTNLLMIGTGTGIAPFRAFIQHIYDREHDWEGAVRLYYGARTGAENLYRNDVHDDLDRYINSRTFQAFEGLSKRPWMDAADTGLDRVLADNAGEIWELMQDPNTHVYLAGLTKTAEDFHKVMAEKAGSRARWHWLREEMIEQNRWSELLYS